MQFFKRESGGFKDLSCRIKIRGLSYIVSSTFLLASKDHLHRQRLKRLERVDSLFKSLSFLGALLVFALLGSILISLGIGGWAAFETFGWAFISQSRWDPGREIFGALTPIYGTLLTSFLAIFMAVPVGFGIAIFLTELCPIVLRRPVGTAIELLAGIPSIIYGMWGFFILVPFLKDTIEPSLISFLSPIPAVQLLFSGPAYGIGILAASLVLAIMILPFITAIARDVFLSVPPVLKEAAFGMGCTTWEVICAVIIPYTRMGLMGGIMLALGRALGETMAVTFVIGNSHHLSASLLAPGTTISATIANEFQEASSPLHTSALIALGFVLFLITFFVLVFARLLLAHIERKGSQ